MNYSQIAQSVLDQATAAGADAEAYIATGSQTQISVDRGQVEKLSKAGSKGLGVRVIQNGQMGYAYTSDFSAASVAKTTQAALMLAQVSDADEFRTLPEPQPIPDADLQIYDPEIEAQSTDAKVAFAKAVEAAALAADPRVAMTNRATYVDGVAHVHLANTKGFSGGYAATFAGSFVMAIAADGDERATAFGLGVSTAWRDLDAEKIGREAGERAAKLLGGKPVKTQEATVVYSPFAAAGLVGALSRALTAESMQRNRSFLQGKMGQEVGADVLTILDNGRLPGGMATRPFDDEGVPTNATRLIDEGVLQAVLQDTYTANRGSGQSTGNASRGSHRGAPSLAPSNFYIQPGPQTPDELIGVVANGFYVVNVMNTAAINPVSGDYSVSAQGFWIENGALTHPVNNVTIALPLDKLLKNVKAVANDLIFLPFGGSIGAPTMRVDGMMIGGI
ncbi:MAG: TldD/PmbA family protein [Caldilineaceae bacterium]